MTPPAKTVDAAASVAVEAESTDLPGPRRLRPALRGELALIIVGYAAYTLTRNAVPTHRAAAFHRAEAIWRAERALHINIELTVNHALDRITPLIVGMNYYYATLHFVITIGVLIWLYTRHPAAYRMARSVLFTATVLSLIGFYFYALAPPRFLTGHGFIDTVVVHHTWGSWASGDVDKVSNQYAAMPSDHIAWATWCAVVMWRNTRHRWIKVVAAVYPAFTLTVIIATANHFLADAAGGLVTLACAYALTILSRILPWRRPIGRQPSASTRWLPAQRIQG